MKELLELQLHAEREGLPYSFCLLVSTSGTTPRAAGSKMLVFANGTINGSIGGGIIEKMVIADALTCLKTGGVMLKNYENTSNEMGPSCGGIASVYIEARISNRPKLVICGAGHIGIAVMRIAERMGYEIYVVDTRDPSTLPPDLGERLHQAESFHTGIASLDVGPGAYYLISTYSHPTDCEALGAALEKDASYIGMMGSHAKIRGIFEKLKARGVSQQALNGVYAPVGLDIGGEIPEEIALSIVAELQAVRYKKSAKPMKVLRKESQIEYEVNKHE